MDTLCVVCLKGGGKHCGKCKSISYCSKECQKLHWDIHKTTCEKTILIEDISRIFCCEIVMDSNIYPYMAINYHGQKKIGNEIYWFFKESEKNINGNILTWFCSKRKNDELVMSSEQFANFYFTGKCSVLAHAVALCIYKALSNGRVTFQGKVVRSVCVLGMDVNKSYERNVFCFTWPIPKGNDTSNWDCDRLHNDKHQVVGITFKDGTSCMLDFAAAQYGIYNTYLGGKGWFYYENLDFELPDESLEYPEMESWDVEILGESRDNKISSNPTEEINVVKKERIYFGKCNLGNFYSIVYIEENTEFDPEDKRTNFVFGAYQALCDRLNIKL